MGINPKQDANAMSMFYNLKIAVDLVPLDDYDIILYARADTVCTQDIDLSVAQQYSDNVVFIPSKYDWTGINDQMAFGTPAAMFQYSRIFDNIDEYIIRGVLVPSARPEKMLQVHLEASELIVKRFGLEYELNPRRKDISLKHSQ